MQRQEEERKRTREELEALREAAKKKLKGKDKAAAMPANAPRLQGTHWWKAPQRATRYD